MKKKIFFKEFLGKRTSTLIFTVAFLFINIILIFTTKNLKDLLDGTQKPDAVIYGRRIGFLSYADIADEMDYLIKHDTDNDLEIVPCKTHIVDTINSGSMEETNIDVNAFKIDYLEKHIQPLLCEGRLPEQDNEIVVGNYFIKFFKLKVGDNMYIDNQINEIEDYREFKIVGVIKNPTFQFSIIKIFQEDYQPNKILIYFNNGTKSMDKFEVIKANIERELPSNNFGPYSTQYDEMENVIIIVSFVVHIVIYLIIALLIILYITKGMKKNIGILKALGIKDRNIFNLIANNFLFFTVVINFIAIGITNILFVLLNKSIDNFYGFKVSAFRFTWDMVLVNIAFNVLLYIIVFASIKIRTTKSTPKESMLRG